jgi:hypothetical protein
VRTGWIVASNEKSRRNLILSLDRFFSLSQGCFMVPRQVLPLIVLCGLLSGCSFTYYTARNIVLVPCQRINEVVADHRNRKLAKQAWADMEKTHPPGTFSRDYAKGFVEGYDDFLDDGGTGLPPPIPPWPYLQNRKQTPEGKQSAYQWFDGFAHGAAAAKASGYRELRIIPTATTGPYQSPPPIRTSQQSAGPGNTALSPFGTQPRPEMLPPPRATGTVEQPR